jgi:hypothetical protein
MPGEIYGWWDAPMSVRSAYYLMGFYDTIKGLRLESCVITLLKSDIAKAIEEFTHSQIDEDVLARRGWYVIPLGPTCGVVACKVKFVSNCGCDKKLECGIRGIIQAIKLGNYYISPQRFNVDLLIRHNAIIRGDKYIRTR